MIVSSLIIVLTGDVDDTDASSQVTLHLLLSVQTILTGREFVSPDISAALTPLQADHTLTSLAALLVLETAGDGQARDGDCQCQSSALPEESLS